MAFWAWGFLGFGVLGFLGWKASKKKSANAAIQTVQLKRLVLIEEAVLCEWKICYSVLLKFKSYIFSYLALFLSALLSHLRSVSSLKPVPKDVDKFAAVSQQRAVASTQDGSEQNCNNVCDILRQFWWRLGCDGKM